MIQDTVVIGGECSLETRIEGDCDLTSMVEGDPDVLVVEGGGQTYPHYSGSYTVNPSTSQQVLQTDGKVMDNDVTVEAVPQGSATTPATIITADPTISVSSGGLITAQVSKTQQITPTVQEGYVSAGTPGNVGVSGSNTEQLSVQGAQTIHPSTSDQSIASGKYLTGAQTFKAVTVSGLTADKVLTGTTVEIGDSDDSDRIMKVVGTASGGITPTGTKQITANGTSIDVYSYQYADVAVPNSYSAGDEGKVVSNGTLVAQTSDTVTTNNTYDTTLINSLTVNVSGSSGITVDEIAMESAPTGAVTLNSATEIKAYALYGKPITSISAPYVTKLDGNAFANTAIVNLDNPFPSMVPSTSTLGNTAGGYIFGNMTALKRVYLTQAGTWCARLDTFRGCSELVVLRLPNQTGNTEQRATTDCRKLKVIDWGKGRVHMNAFNGCYLFDTLILRDSSVQALSNVSAFTNTPFRGYNSLSGTIYVPSSLISSYQTASNWSSLYAEGHCTFSALENSTYKNIDWDDSALWQ